MASKKTRMTALERREQLIDVARTAFAQKGYDGSSVEEIAARANVSKPVVYEHFGGKEGLYAVVVDREVQALLTALEEAMETAESPRLVLEQAVLALLDYIESNTDGFRVLVRDVPSNRTRGSFSSVIGDVAEKTEHLLARQFKRTGYRPQWAPLYAQMLVGTVSQVGQWWLDVRKPSKNEVAAHVVNLTWNGMHNLRPEPTLRRDRLEQSDPRPAALTDTELAVDDENEHPRSGNKRK